MQNLISSQSLHPAEVDEIFHILNLGNIRNVIYWYKFFKMSKSIPGVIVECGIGRAKSLLVISAINKILEENEGGCRKIFGFDSFQGFPEPSLEDASPRNPKKGEWAYSPSGKYEYTPYFIKNIIENAGGGKNNITLTKGYFDESLKTYSGGKIAILHIDCDLYQSYKDVFENLYEYVSPGGLIVIDDFLLNNEGVDDFPGARKAVNEFCERTNLSLQESIRGTPYIIKS